MGQGWNVMNFSCHHYHKYWTWLTASNTETFCHYILRRILIIWMCILSTFHVTFKLFYSLSFLLNLEFYCEQNFQLKSVNLNYGRWAGNLKSHLVLQSESLPFTYLQCGVPIESTDKQGRSNVEDGHQSGRQLSLASYHFWAFPNTTFRGVPTPKPVPLPHWPHFLNGHVLRLRQEEEDEQRHGEDEGGKKKEEEVLEVTEHGEECLGNDESEEHAHWYVQAQSGRPDFQRVDLTGYQAPHRPPWPCKTGNIDAYERHHRVSIFLGEVGHTIYPEFLPN